MSIVVLPRPGLRLPRLIDSIRTRTVYPDVEIVVVDDGEHRPPLRALIRDRGADLTIVQDSRSVSDGALRNAAVAQASGDVLCFMHDDVEVLHDRWLDDLVGLVLQPGTGVVGAKLLYPSGSVQHAGIVLGIAGTVGHVHRGIDRLAPGYFSRASLTQHFSAVSMACMVVRREAFERVGGFDEVHLSGVYEDVDLCLRLGEAGWRTAWTPHAELLHTESPDEVRETDGENGVRNAREIRYLRSRWADHLERDPAYNPNLSFAHETWPLAWPPRVSYR